jgi:rod shape determining protein RodA
MSLSDISHQREARLRRGSAERGVVAVSAVDWWVVIACAALAAVGWMAMRGAAGTDAALLGVAKKQALWLLLAACAAGALQLWDYTRLLAVVPFLYVANLLGLVALPFFAEDIKGARSWVQFGGVSFQPSETMKLLTVAALAQWFAVRPEEPRALRHMVVPLGLAGVPAAVILAQPDFGTAAVFVVVGVAMLWWAGAPRWMMGLLVAAMIAGGVGAYPLLKPYQKERIRVFLDPGRDPRGRGYNVIQSKVAIGSGGVLGKGWGQGTQTRMKFLPEHQTDFIFASAAEQFGLAGIAFILSMYFLLAARMLRAMAEARDRYGSLLVAGLMTVFFTHVLLNIGMNMGMLPVTGLPLPLMSYGGTFAMTTGLLVGVVLSVGARRFLLAE